MLKCALTTALAIFGAPLCAADLIGSFTWEWPSKESRFGGISGIEITSQGSEFVAVSDHGFILNGTIERDAGSISAISATIDPLLTTKNKAVTGRHRDAEGIAVSPDGTIFVSYEGNHRVASHMTSGSGTTLLPRHESFGALQANSGLEGLAIDMHDRLYTLPERSGDAKRPFPLFEFSADKWSITHKIPRRGAFLPVGLDFDSSGTLFLLERHLSIFGFQSRVRTFRLDQPDLGERTILQTKPGQFDNLEGISVWYTPKGDKHMTLISDDNFKIFQRTELIEYQLPSP